jgi:hypothetical protein
VLILIQATTAPWYQDPITVATWVIAVATVLYFATTVGLLLLTKRMFEASHRPYLGASSVAMTKTPGPPPLILFEIPVNNFGTLPAKDFTHEVNIVADGVLIPNVVREIEPVTVVMPTSPLRLTMSIDDPREYQAVDSAGILSVVIKCRYKGVQQVLPH